MTAVSSPRDLTPDVALLRAETPGCAGVAHFNHAGSSLMPQPVIDALLGHLEREVRTGGYEAEDEAAARIDAYLERANTLARLAQVDGTEGARASRAPVRATIGRIPADHSGLGEGA